jgi:CRISPR-associated protein Cmr1
MPDLNQLIEASAIQCKTFNCTVLTPLFLHGWQETVVTGHGRPVNRPVSAEFRIPSMKGVLRYWWRTLQPLKLQALQQKEQELFGGTSGDKGQRSPLLLKVSILDRGPSSENMNTSSLCPHKGGMPSLALPADREFAFELAVHQRNAARLSEYEAICKFMFLLAGFGQRSRRGAGSLQVEGLCWQNIKEYQNSLRETLQSLNCANDFEFPNGNTGGCLLQRKRRESTEARGAFHPILQRVWVGSDSRTAEEARRQISNAGHLANPSGKAQYLGNVGGKGIARLASPLLCTVRKIGEAYCPIVSEVSSPHLGKNEYIQRRNVLLEALGVKV